MNTRTGRVTPFTPKGAAYSTPTPRTLANQQQTSAKKPFVSGGVVSNFTGTAQQPQLQAVQQQQTVTPQSKTGQQSVTPQIKTAQQSAIQKIKTAPQSVMPQIKTEQQSVTPQMTTAEQSTDRNTEQVAGQQNAKSQMVQPPPVVQTQNDVPTPVQSGAKKHAEPMTKEYLEATKTTDTIEADIEMSGGDGSSDGVTKRRFGGGVRKPYDRKLSRQSRRMRENRILRKMFPPKNALMALNELFGQGECDFNILPYEGGFTADIQINNVRFVGRGLSKMAAKADASERALRDLVITKISAFQRKVNNQEGSGDAENGAQKDDVVGDVDSEMMDGGEVSDDADFPMVHLASFALHKLFTEWQSDGFDVTSVVNQVKGGSTEPSKKRQLPIRNELPANHNTLHPCMLLQMMRPNISYVDLGGEGQTPNIIHRTGISVDDKNFIGVARNKKAARKSAARQACNALFGTSFVKEELDFSEN